MATDGEQETIRHRRKTETKGEKMPTPGTVSAPVPAALTTPCTWAQLVEWVEHVVEAVNSGPLDNTATVTTTSITISVT